MNILVTVPQGPVGKTFFPERVKLMVENLGSVCWNDSVENWTREELRRLIEGKDVCITGWGTARIDGYVLQNADALKLIAHTGGTIAPIISDEVYERGITVISGNAVYAESVAEGVICYILASYRDIIHYVHMLKSGIWPSRDFTTRGLLDRTIGLVGYGMVSRYLVPMLKVFNTQIRVSSDHMSEKEAQEAGVEKVPIERLFAESDVVSIHLADTLQNYHRVDKRLLSLMKDGGLFINTARGEVVNEEDLLEVLSTGRISAVLDVFHQEPLPANSPLLKLENVMCIPHMAGPTTDRRSIVTERLIEDIKRYEKGEPLAHAISQSYSHRMSNR